MIDHQEVKDSLARWCGAMIQKIHRPFATLSLVERALTELNRVLYDYFPNYHRVQNFYYTLQELARKGSPHAEVISEDFLNKLGCLLSARLPAASDASRDKLAGQSPAKAQQEKDEVFPAVGAGEANLASLSTAKLDSSYESTSESSSESTSVECGSEARAECGNSSDIYQEWCNLILDCMMGGDHLEELAEEDVSSFLAADPGIQDTRFFILHLQKLCAPDFSLQDQASKGSWYVCILIIMFFGGGDDSVFDAMNEESRLVYTRMTRGLQDKLRGAGVEVTIDYSRSQVIALAAFAQKEETWRKTVFNGVIALFGENARLSKLLGFMEPHWAQASDAGVFQTSFSPALPPVAAASSSGSAPLPRDSVFAQALPPQMVSGLDAIPPGAEAQASPTPGTQPR